VFFFLFPFPFFFCLLVGSAIAGSASSPASHGSTSHRIPQVPAGIHRRDRANAYTSRLHSKVVSLKSDVRALEKEHNLPVLLIPAIYESLSYIDKVQFWTLGLQSQKNAAKKQHCLATYAYIKEKVDFLNKYIEPTYIGSIEEFGSDWHERRLALDKKKTAINNSVRISFVFVVLFI
jgi:hypothetical protein